MRRNSHLFSKRDNPRFFDNQGRTIGLHREGEYLPHSLENYKADDYIGRFTGEFFYDEASKLSVIEVEVEYLHLMKIKGTNLPFGEPQKAKLWMNENDVFPAYQSNFATTNLARRLATLIRRLYHDLTRPPIKVILPNNLAKIDK
jgi:hypothetical protein